MIGMVAFEVSQSGQQAQSACRQRRLWRGYHYKHWSERNG